MSSGAISVSMSMTGMPASIILLTGAVRVPMPNAWIATKSHFCEAMLSIAERCLTASSWPSNQVTSTLNSLPQYSAACLPWAHQVACRPALENAAFSGLADLPASLAIAAPISGLIPMPPSIAAAPPPSAAPRIKSRRECEPSFEFEPNFVVLIMRLSLVSRVKSKSAITSRARKGKLTRDFRDSNIRDA